MWDVHDDAVSGHSSENATALRERYNVAPESTCTARTGIVVIGRNEGDRLQRSLESAAAAKLPLVYVDSASVDGSVGVARNLGIDVLRLNCTTPLTAARARNAGFAHLLARYPELEFVQFLDGDCQLCDGWVPRAEAFLRHRCDVGIVCGRIREWQPTLSIYHRVCSIEWDQPLGRTTACGGNAMVRARALRQVNGYDPDIIAAEDDEVCLRLRRAGWFAHRLGDDMVLHDAAMVRFAQWWRRAVRAGYAYAQNAALHGRTPVRFFVHESRSAWFWGLILPFMVLGLAWPSRGASLLLLGAYFLLGARVYRRMRRKGVVMCDAAVYAGHCVLVKLPQTVGQLRFRLDSLLARRSAALGHKRPLREVVGVAPAAETRFGDLQVGER